MPLFDRKNLIVGTQIIIDSKYNDSEPLTFEFRNDQETYPINFVKSNRNSLFEKLGYKLYRDLSRGNYSAVMAYATVNRKL